MNHDLLGKEYWLTANGRQVTIRGKEYIIHASCYYASYPYARQVLTVHAEMLDKNDPEYLKVKKDLGDDWSTDILDSSIEIYCDVYNQLFGK